MRKKKIKSNSDIEESICKQERFIFGMVINKKLTVEEALLFEIMVEIHHFMRASLSKEKQLTQWADNLRFQKKFKKLQELF